MTRRNRTHADASHARALRELAGLGPVRTRTVRISDGELGLTEFGPSEAEPVLLMPGGNSPAPALATWFPEVASERRLMVPDLPGMPGPSTAAPLPSGRRAQGDWCARLLDALELETTPIIAASFGAGLTLRLAGARPDRITLAALVVPLGFGYGSLTRLATEVMLPAIAHRYRPAQHRVDRVAYAMAGSAATDTIRADIDAALTGKHLETRLPGRTSRAELAGLHAPVMIAATDDDPFFPAHVVLPRARAVVPNLTSVLTVPGRHFPPTASLKRIDRSVNEFLRRSGATS